MPAHRPKCRLRPRSHSITLRRCHRQLHILTPWRQVIRFTILTITIPIITLGIPSAGRWSLVLALGADTGAAVVISGAGDVAKNRGEQRQRLALPDAQSSSSGAENKNQYDKKPPCYSPELFRHRAPVRVRDRAGKRHCHTRGFREAAAAGRTPLASRCGFRLRRRQRGEV